MDEYNGRNGNGYQPLPSKNQRAPKPPGGECGAWIKTKEHARMMNVLEKRLSDQSVTYISEMTLKDQRIKELEDQLAKAQQAREKANQIIDKMLERISPLLPIVLAMRQDAARGKE